MGGKPSLPIAIQEQFCISLCPVTTRGSAGCNLAIKEHQTFAFRNKGILRIDNSHMFSTVERGNIYVDIKLE